MWFAFAINACVCYNMCGFRVSNYVCYPTRNATFNIVLHRGWLLASVFAFTVAVAATAQLASPEHVALLFMAELVIVVILSQTLLFIVINEVGL